MNKARFTGARRRSSRARAVMPETLEALPTTAGAALGLAGALGAAAALRGRLGGEASRR